MNWIDKLMKTELYADEIEGILVNTRKSYTLRGSRTKRTFNSRGEALAEIGMRVVLEAARVFLEGIRRSNEQNARRVADAEAGQASEPERPGAGLQKPPNGQTHDGRQEVRRHANEVEFEQEKVSA